MGEDKWSKKCPDCGEDQIYQSKKAVRRAKKKNTSCKSCANKGKRNPNYKEVTEDEKQVTYFKYCPECGEVQTYSSKDTFRVAKRDDTLCYSCSNLGERNGAYKENKEYKRDCPGCGKTLEYSFSSGLSMSKRYNQHCSECAANGKGKRDDLYRNCSECDKKIYYSDERTLKNAKENSAKCRKCKSKDQPSPMKHLNYEFSEEHRRKIGETMREKLKGVSLEERFGKEKAEKARRKMIEGLTGMDYDEYMNSLDEKQKYEKKARNMSKKRNLTELDNYGKENYELDHIYPVSKGFYNDVSLEAISNLDNLQMLTSLENKKKGNSIPEEIPSIIKRELDENEE